MDKSQLYQIRDRLVVKAKEVGKSVEEMAADEIADLKTSARDSIIRAGIVAFIIGVIVGKLVL